MTKRGYIRTSTDKQLADRQIDQLKVLCDEVYIEDSMSATRRDRPAYDAVMTALRRGDVFVVVSLDRAYRSVIDALIELDKLQARGIEFLSLSQSFDTRTPEGKLLYTVCAALAEWERSILSQRTKDGMAAAQRRGRHIGRPSKLSRHDLDWASAQLTQKQPQSLKSLAQQLGVSTSTLRRALKRGAFHE